jgi:peptidoglycan L-alanyl-D-glutamate endopeptidase CwlK
MPRFSERSQSKLDKCHSDLAILFTTVVKYYDCTIVCGHRGKREQDEAFNSGKSKVEHPHSKHNFMPSLAVDVAPYDAKLGAIDWNNAYQFYHFAGYVRAVSTYLGIRIRWGGDWNGDNDFKDQKFMDLVHYELI